MPQVSILIVEDERIVATDIRQRLTSVGYTVVGIASTGEEAIEMTERTSPELVLMDITLKGEMDGVQAAAAILSQRDIPILYLTAHADSGTLERVKSTGPFGYVLKPFDERDLLTTVEMALYKFSTDKKLRESERWLSTTLRSIGDAVITTRPPREDYLHESCRGEIHRLDSGRERGEGTYRSLSHRQRGNRYR